MAVSDMKKLYSLLLILTPIKKVHAFSEIYLGIDNICSNKQWRNAKEGFCLEILSWSQDSGNKNKTPL